MSSIEEFVLKVKRSGLSKNVHCPNFQSIVKGQLPIPKKWGKSLGTSVKIEEWLFILRLRAKKTQRDLAKMVKVSHQSIHNWENSIKGTVRGEDFVRVIEFLEKRKDAPL